MGLNEGSSSSSYYSILGVNHDSSGEEIRRAYRKLAMQWHPDKWTRTPALLGEAKRKFQQIQEAYSVLSDHTKRTMYDAGLYDLDEEQDEGFADFLQEMVSLMNDVKKEEKVYSMEELQSMFWDMAKGFEFPGSAQQSSYHSSDWICTTTSYNDSGSPANIPWNSNFVERSSFLDFSNFQTYGGNPFCR